MTADDRPAGHSANGTDQANPVVDLRDPVIDLRDRTLRELTPVSTMSGRPAALQDHHRLVTIDTDDLLERAERFVYEHYLRIGFCEPSPRERVEELAPWADRAHMHAVIDDDEMIVGTIRTIFGNYGELPVAQFERTDHEMPDPVCELSSLVVRQRDRGTGVIEHLYRAGWLNAFRLRASAIVGLIDPWLFDAFVDHYGLPFRVIGTPSHYMGTDPVPVGMPLVGPAYDDLARRNPAFWLWTLEALSPAEIGAWGLPLILHDDVAAAMARAERDRG